MAGPADKRLLAVPNVSDGSERGVIDHLREALAPPVALLDVHSDAVHNRTVFTIAGEDRPLGDALERLARRAIERIDIGRQHGAHPRIGSIDVCPVVWHHADLRPRAVDLARTVAERLGSIGLPVFLYGELATTPERRERAYFRRGGHLELARRMEAGELDPDFGPRRAHPTAGGVLVTARPPLAAFNLELREGTSAEAGQAIAAGLRESGGGLAGVRAIAIELGPGRVQISTNVHDPLAVSLAEVVEMTKRLAQGHGTAPVEAELIGLVPEAALAGWPQELPFAGGFPAERTIEARLAAIAGA